MPPPWGSHQHSAAPARPPRAPSAYAVGYGAPQPPAPGSPVAQRPTWHWTPQQRHARDAALAACAAAQLAHASGSWACLLASAADQALLVGKKKPQPPAAAHVRGYRVAACEYWLCRRVAPRGARREARLFGRLNARQRWRPVEVPAASGSEHGMQRRKRRCALRISAAVLRAKWAGAWRAATPPAWGIGASWRGAWRRAARALPDALLERAGKRAWPCRAAVSRARRAAGPAWPRLLLLLGRVALGERAPPAEPVVVVHLALHLSLIHI